MQETKENRYESPYIVWDTCDIAEAQVKFMVEEEGMSEDEARKSAYTDDSIYENEWDFVLESLGDKLTQYNPDGKWYAEVKGFGWRRLDGHKVFNADSAAKFLQEILPRTDCTFKIYVFDDEKRIEINNFHHDAPTGEWYHVSVHEGGDGN